MYQVRVCIYREHTSVSLVPDLTSTCTRVRVNAKTGDKPSLARRPEGWSGPASWRPGFRPWRRRVAWPLRERRRRPWCPVAYGVFRGACRPWSGRRAWQSWPWPPLTSFLLLSRGPPWPETSTFQAATASATAVVVGVVALARYPTRWRSWVFWQKGFGYIVHRFGFVFGVVVFVGGSISGVCKQAQGLGLFGCGDGC